MRASIVAIEELSNKTTIQFIGKIFLIAPLSLKRSFLVGS